MQCYSTLPWIGHTRAPSVKMAQRGGAPQAPTTAAGGTTQAATYGRSGGGLTRASSHPHIQSTIPQRCLGSDEPEWAGGGGVLGGLSSLKKSGSFNNVSMLHSLLASRPSSAASSEQDQVCQLVVACLLHASYTPLTRLFASRGSSQEQVYQQVEDQGDGRASMLRCYRSSLLHASYTPAQHAALLQV